MAIDDANNRVLETRYPSTSERAPEDDKTVWAKVQELGRSPRRVQAKTLREVSAERRKESSAYTVASKRLKTMQPTTEPIFIGRQLSCSAYVQGKPIADCARGLRLSNLDSDTHLVVFEGACTIQVTETSPTGDQ